MTEFGSRIVRKARSMTADLHVLWPIAQRPMALLPWLLTSGRGVAFRGQGHEFELRDVRFEVRSRDLLGLREVLVDDEYGFVRDILEPAPVVVDLGANAGLFAVSVLAHDRNAEVHSYEPSFETFEVLSANQARNPSHAWTCHRAAVYDGPGTTSFVNEVHSTGSRVADGGDEVVETVGLETIIGRLGRPVDLMKMDIEGSEERALMGKEEVLTNIATLVIEIHPDRCDADAVVDVLRRSYPHLHRVPGRRSSKPLLVASRQELDLPTYSHTARPGPS